MITEDEKKATRRAEAIKAMAPLYDIARSHIMADLKAHGLVEAIRRHEMRKLAIDRAINCDETL